jgi:NAD(P)H-hydrate epimerase
VAGAVENANPVTAGSPELIYLPASSATNLAEPMRGTGVLAIGPGLGQDDWARRLWMQARAVTGVPVVVDADALNLLASNPVKLPADWIITPHPGEAARLLGVPVAEVQRDRLGAVRGLVSRYGAVAVLKGAGTLVGSAHDGGIEVFICERGNPGMATAGMGDVLTGVIAGLRAQIPDSAAAARVGVLVHALAGDAAARDGQRGLLASDLLAQLRAQVNP